MKTRMQPIGNVWSKFPRVVRDLAQSCGKQVRIEMEGKETELDKTLIEAIKDPLTHLVRNAIDHGIEAPGGAPRPGQAGAGVLRLHAFHEGGQVIIEIGDDGGGIESAASSGRRSSTAGHRRRRPTRLSRARADRAGVPARLLDGRRRSPTCPAAAWAWTWSRPTSSASAAHRPRQPPRPRGTTLTIRIPLTLAIVPALV